MRKSKFIYTVYYHPKTNSFGILTDYRDGGDFGFEIAWRSGPVNIGAWLSEWVLIGEL